MSVGHFRLHCPRSAPRGGIAPLILSWLSGAQYRGGEHLETFVSMTTAVGDLNMRTMFALCGRKSPEKDTGKTLGPFKLSLIPLLVLELQGFCPLGSCEMVLLRLSRGAKCTLPRFFFWGSHITWICDTYLIAALSGSSIWYKTTEWIVLWCSHCGEFNLGSTDTAESFTLTTWWMSRSFRMQRSLIFRPEHLCWWRPWGGREFSFTISVQLTRKQAEVTITLPRCDENLLLSSRADFSIRQGRASVWAPQLPGPIIL